MSSSSSSPEPEVIPVKKKGKEIYKEKGQVKVNTKKAQKTPQIASLTVEHGKNEGTNPHWAYKPPPDAVLLDHEVDAREFDWDAVKNDENLELWLIRIPDGVKPKYLEDIKIECPSSFKNERVGTLVRKYATYDIWSVGAGDDQPIVGEEIKGLSPLLPRRRKSGRLYQASKPIARHIVISAQTVSPTPTPNSGLPSTSTPVYKNPPRQVYPKELLKHRFLPYGSGTLDDDVVMDVDAEVVTRDQGVLSEPPVTEIEVTKTKGKKRKQKADGHSAVKSKKARTR